MKHLWVIEIFYDNEWCLDDDTIYFTRQECRDHINYLKSNLYHPTDIGGNSCYKYRSVKFVRVDN